VLAEARRHRIREILATRWTVAASELCEELRVTPVTIRRDLAVLEAQGVLVRSHGGAVSRMSSTSFQPAYETLLRTHPEEKQAIAQAAEQLILDGDTVFLEGSTTVFELARRLADRNRLTVVTNYPPILSVFQRNFGISVMSTGGDLQQDTFYLSGEWALRFLSEIRVDKAVLGVSAIDAAYGVSTSRQPEAQIKRMAIKAARVCIGLADNTKFGKQAFAYVGPVSDLNVLVTDSRTDSRHIEDLREAKVDVRVAPVRKL
jgi:DeoR/GlpR family transcriptional regulator of sugar metabolism